MHPDPPACEKALKERNDSETVVIADHWKLEGHIPFEDALAYLGSNPFGAATVEFWDLLQPDAFGKIQKLKAV